jgi:hypothetical protein
MLATRRSDRLSNLVRRQTACRTIRVETQINLVRQLKESQLLQQPVQNFQTRRLHSVDLLVEKTP